MTDTRTRPHWTETWLEDEIVCPYCGYRFSDSYEYADSDEFVSDVHCDECENDFDVKVSYDTSYTTTLPEDEP